MSVSVTMPALGESVTEGTVTRWLKAEGDQVTADEPLLEVSTDKVDTEIPAPASGVLQKIVVQEDETVEVGTELAVIGDGESGGGSADANDSGDASADESQDAAEEAPAEDAGNDDAAAEDDAADDAQASDDTEEAPQEQAPADDAPAADAPSTEQDSAAKQPDADDSSKGSAQGTDVTMPALGESVTEGTVTRWLKQVGDEVQADEPLLEVSTDKVDTEIPSPASGTLLEIKVNEDETVDVGAVLAVIGDKGTAPAEGKDDAPKEEAPKQEAAQDEADAPKQDAPKEEAPKDEAPKQEAPKQEAPKEQAPKEEPKPAPAPAAAPAPARAQAAPAPAPAKPAADQSDDSTAYVTPLVRKLAAENNVDLGSLKGTGVGGRIRKQDVLAAAEAAKAPAPAPAAAPASGSAPAPAAAATNIGAETSNLRGSTEKLSRLRRLIANRMVESLQTSAQLTTVVEVDVTRVAQLRDRVKADFQAREGVKLSYLPFFALAAVEALKAHPVVNSELDMEAGTITYPAAEHLGIAVDSNRGLVVPVIHNASDLNLAGLARKIDDLAQRTRDRQIGPDELTGGTFTLTNTGSRGALFDTPIINQPQAAILGTGAVVKRPAVIDDPNLGEIIAVRSFVYLALSYDHRVVDGADAARFLGTMKERLEAGNFEADLGI